jgi:hypothetical protein
MHTSLPPQYESDGQFTSPAGQLLMQAGTSGRQARGAQLTTGRRQVRCAVHVPVSVS